MMQDRMDLTGAWFGSYAYLGTTQPDVAFIATIEEAGGLVTGTTSERIAEAGLEIELKAILRGVREGSEVSFTKAYDGEGIAAHAIDYAGTLDEAGTRIAGAWQMPGAMGSFEMTRTLLDDAAGEELEAEAPLQYDEAVLSTVR